MIHGEVEFGGRGKNLLLLRRKRSRVNNCALGSRKRVLRNVWWLLVSESWRGTVKWACENLTAASPPGHDLPDILPLFLDSFTAGPHSSINVFGMFLTIVFTGSLFSHLYNQLPWDWKNCFVSTSYFLSPCANLQDSWVGEHQNAYGVIWASSNFGLYVILQ